MNRESCCKSEFSFLRILEYIVQRFKPFTGNFLKILEFVRIKVGSGSVIPEADPDQNEADQKH